MLSTMTRKRLLASTAFVTATLIAVPAFAQSGEDSANAEEAIVVTGSRIPHPELDSASPVTSVGSIEVKQSGVTRVEDLLNSLPQVFAGQGGNLSNGATGTATVDLRNLGARRTLVLVNGRRLVPGDPRAPEQDINIIPSALIKRVDVLTGGASSVYGADAVSGVVNFVMDTDFEGFKLDTQYSFFMHNNDTSKDVTDALDARIAAGSPGYTYPKGNVTDGGAIEATAMFGAGFDDGRGHVTGYAGYRKINPILQSNRDYSACTVSANSPANVARLGRLYNCGGSGTSAPGSFYTGGNYYHVEGHEFVPGQVLFNFAPYNYYQRPDERYTAGLFANYEVSESFKPYMEFMFMDDRSVAQIAPSGNFFNTTEINCDNPLLSAQQLGVIGCAPGSTGTVPLYIGRRNVEGGGRQDDLQHTTYRGVIGARGDFAKGFSYDAYYQYSRVNFAQTYRNDFSITRLTQALDVIEGPDGTPVCRNDANGCVPYNIFQEGGVTAEALDFLQIPLFSRGQTTEQIVEGSVTFLGEEYGIQLPWATEGLGINVGGQYRKSTLNFEVDANFRSGDGAGQGGSTDPVAGNIQATEAYAEASLPLVQDKPFFDDLRIGAGYRRSHYKVDGNGVSNSFNTDTWKIEGTWSPVKDIKFRVSFNRSVRAPNAVELFAAQSVQLDGSLDPCAGPLGADGTPGGSGYTLAQCALTGVTAAQYGSIAANPARQYNGLTGGNPDLTPEIADSVTVGLVLTPRLLPGFQATVDYFNIRLKDQIGTVGADNIITGCLDGTNPEYCPLIVRNAGGNLFRTPDGYIVDTNLNAGSLSTRGIDVSAAYTTRVGSGSVNASISGTYLDSLYSTTSGECAKLYGAGCGTPSPRWRHTARLGYTFAQGANITGTWRYFSAVKDENPASNPGNARISAQSYFDLAATVPFEDKFTFHIGARNLLDREPPVNGLQLPVYESGNTFPQIYDAMGRYIFVGVTLDL